MLCINVSQPPAIKQSPTHGAVNEDRRLGGQPNRTANEVGKSSYKFNYPDSVEQCKSQHNNKKKKTTKKIEKLRKHWKIVEKIKTNCKMLQICEVNQNTPRIVN